jgi:hypothetical protein
MNKVLKVQSIDQADLATTRINISNVAAYSVQIQYDGAGTASLLVSSQVDPDVSDDADWSTVEDSEEVLADVDEAFMYDVENRGALWLKIEVATITDAVVSVVLKG